jgi:hypothetical protein
MVELIKKRIEVLSIGVHYAARPTNQGLALGMFLNWSSERNKSYTQTSFIVFTNNGVSLED